MDLQSAMRDLERRLTSKRDALRSAATTAAQMGDVASHERLSLTAEEADGALRCLPLMTAGHESRRKCDFGGDALVAETFLMLDCASRRASLSSSLIAAGGVPDPMCDVLKELVRRAMSIRPPRPVNGVASA